MTNRDAHVGKGTHLNFRGDARAALWENLAEGSTVVVPLAPAQWAPLYGMLKDPSGGTWVLDVEAPYTPS